MLSLYLAGQRRFSRGSKRLFFSQGRYHLMYLYRHADDTFHWGHVSSQDLLHWRHHLDALTALPGDAGCFSGGAFDDDDDTAWLSYWIYNNNEKKENQGIGLAYAAPPYEHWEQLPKAVIASNEWGIINGKDGIAIGCGDPSNIWKKNGVYFMQAGNKAVLDAYGRTDDAPTYYRGDWTELYKSFDLYHWSYCGRFYQRREDNSWTSESEDNMCPSYLPLPNQAEDGQLTDTMLQLFISHNRGCQYYMGIQKGETFFPQRHGRMSWADDTFFAPEASLDIRNRQIMFVWLRDDLSNQFEEREWCGVYSLPRQLWIDQKGRLRMKPVEELKKLRIRSLQSSNQQGRLNVDTPLSFELHAIADDDNAVRLNVLRRENGDNVEIGYDPIASVLYVDATSSGTCQRAIRESAPLLLDPGERIELTCYVDHSVVEVFANERQAITRRIYNLSSALPYIYVKGAEQINIWEMAASMPY